MLPGPPSRSPLWLTLFLVMLLACSSPLPEATQPNVLFIYVDDLGWRDLGVMGSPYYETPNVDRLASQGLLFTHAYANAPNCAPSRASLLTGQYTPRHGIYTVGSAERGDVGLRKLVPVENAGHGFKPEPKGAEIAPGKADINRLQLDWFRKHLSDS